MRASSNVAKRSWVSGWKNHCKLVRANHGTKPARRQRYVPVLELSEGPIRASGYKDRSNFLLYRNSTKTVKSLLTPRSVSGVRSKNFDYEETNENACNHCQNFDKSTSED